MRKTLIAASLAALVLTACGQEEPPTAVQPGVAATQGAQTPPGAAGEAAGNKAPANVTDDVPTQQQLAPNGGKSGGAD